MNKTTDEEVFDRDAMGFLIAFVRKHKSRPFCAEAVTLAAADAGLAPVDLRRWGQVFQQAAKDGVIRRSRVAFRRVLGNGTLTLGWEAA